MENIFPDDDSRQRYIRGLDHMSSAFTRLLTELNCTWPTYEALAALERPKRNVKGNAGKEAVLSLFSKHRTQMSRGCQPNQSLLRQPGITMEGALAYSVQIDTGCELAP